MAKIDELVEGFLAQKKIAIVGVSDKRETGCNLSYKKFKEAGQTVGSQQQDGRVAEYEQIAGFAPGGGEGQAEFGDGKDKNQPQQQSDEVAGGEAAAEKGGQGQPQRHPA